ncbi:hypothetical protein K491DRAFT_720575 [Lophiostoma macrostomum CBS 122681]|uniref:Uncharacterized protein n=1 Tax=Lophiostoma macrostomum CBS 122681 TaxID=1314788 RepID=A0A6A6SWS6_9PLEO|nr:hypothetical protein K491DRAFT_720575 [Lophiostoma macrostomum CBS 122681]
MPRRRINTGQVRANKQKYSDATAASPEYHILDALVKHTLSIENAVQNIIDKTIDAANSQPELTEEEKKRYPVPSSVGNMCYTFAVCIIECAQRTESEQQDSLVDLIVRLQDVELLDPKTADPLKVDGKLVWKELPTFGYSFADELGSVNPQNIDMTAEERRRWENLTIFCAKLSVRSKFNLMLWALTALYYAFGPWEKGVEPQSAHYAVRVACLWYIHAADKMWELIGDQDKLWEHYTLENWKRWKHCLVNGQNVGKLGQEALSEIERVEARHPA